MRAFFGSEFQPVAPPARSLFQVVLVSLLLSWVTAITLTPLLCVMFLKPPEPSAGGQTAEPADPYSGSFYGGYRAFLRACIRMRVVTLSIVLAVFAASIWAFGYVDQSFFPPSTRPQFMIDLWAPQGTHIEDTTAIAELFSKGVLFVLTYVVPIINCQLSIINC